MGNNKAKEGDRVTDECQCEDCLREERELEERRAEAIKENKLFITDIYDKRPDYVKAGLVSKESMDVFKCPRNMTYYYWEPLAVEMLKELKEINKRISKIEVNTRLNEKGN